MSEARALIADTVERLFGDALGPEALARAEAGQWPGALWGAVEEAGLPRVLLRPENGGAGGDWLDVLEIARAAGRHGLPLPLLETILGAWLLEQSGLPVPPGPIGLAPEPIETAVAAIERVPWGRSASNLVVALRRGGALRVARFSAAEIETRRGYNLAREPRDTLLLTGTAGETGTSDLAPGAVQAYGALIRCGQMAGALERILEQTVGYARERIQFGRPIGSFQIIQQETARLAGQVAAAGLATEVAFRAAAEAGRPRAATIGADGDPAFEIACAKVLAGEAAEIGPRIAHQVHGAIGFTYEHSLHFSTRRLWAWRSEFGGAEAWAQQIGEAVATGGGRIWPLVTSR